jgi:hypothetical protein
MPRLSAFNSYQMRCVTAALTVTITSVERLSTSSVHRKLSTNDTRRVIYIMVPHVRYNIMHVAVV